METQQRYNNQVIQVYGARKGHKDTGQLSVTVSG
jgi:hypothetical protein